MVTRSSHLRFTFVLIAAVTCISANARAQGEAALPRARVVTHMAMVIDTLRLIEAESSLETFRQAHPGTWSFLEDPYNPVDSSALSLDELNRAHLALRRLADAAYARHGSLAGSPFGGLFDNTAVSTASPLLPPQAVLVSGLTTFIVERAKDEAAFGFLLTLKRQIKTDSTFISTALPRSWRLVGRIDTETFQTLMPSLRSAFIRDLNEFPRLIGTAEFHSAIKLDPTNAHHARNITYLQGLSIAYARGLELRQGTTPAVALSRLVEVNPTQLNDASARQALHLVGLLAREYAAAGGAPLIEELSRGEPRLRRYFFALAAQDVGQIERYNSLLPGFLSLVGRHETDAMALLNQLHSVREALSGISPSHPADAKPFGGDFLTSTGSVLQILNSAHKFVPNSSSRAQFTEFISAALHLHEALVNRDYGSLITWLVQQPEIKLEGPQLKYFSLAAALSGAQNSAEVSTALRTVGAPVGSFRAKRNQHGRTGPVRFSLTAYVGAAFGKEETRGLETEETQDFIGIAVPVGLELSWGIPIGSFSVFAPMLDVGTVASARLRGGGVETEPEIGFRQIFAPGVSAVLGITRSVPLSVGFGLQYVSDLRQTSDGESKVNVVRKLFFIGVDTTIFRF